MRRKHRHEGPHISIIFRRPNLEEKRLNHTTSFHGEVVPSMSFYASHNLHAGKWNRERDPGEDAACDQNLTFGIKRNAPKITPQSKVNKEREYRSEERRVGKEG